MTRLVQMLLGVLLIALAPTAIAAPNAVIVEQHSFIDQTRPIRASMGFAGSETRRIDVRVWLPNADDTPRPLVIYSHGTFGAADDATHLVDALVAAGYVVAAPDYPLTSRAAYTRIRFADISDVAQQVKDIKFVIDSLLAHPRLGKLIDPARIGTTGHSLGGVTSYFASSGAQTRDRRIAATAPIGAGDPVAAALASNMGLWGTQPAAVPVPVLLLSAEHDVFARITGQPHSAFARLLTPKHEIMIKGGYHIAFRDGRESHPGGRNPDCLFFEANMPGVTMPGCESAGTFIDPLRQQEITRTALVAFFDAYLKRDGKALKRLAALGKTFPEVRLLSARSRGE